jgi:hypothetical protein
MEHWFNEAGYYDCWGTATPEITEHQVNELIEKSRRKPGDRAPRVRPRRLPKRLASIAQSDMIY